MNARLKSAAVLMVSVFLLVGCQGPSRGPEPVLLMGDNRDVPQDKATHLSRLLAWEEAAVRRSRFVGHDVPNVILQDQNDCPFMLTGLRGNWVVLHFFPEEDIPACSCNATRFTTCLTELGSVRNARVYGITTASPVNLRAYVETHGLALNLLADRDHTVLEQCGAWVNAPLVNGRCGRVARSTMIIDPEGVVRYHWTEVIPADHAERLQRKLAQLQALASRASPGYQQSQSRDRSVARASEEDGRR